MTRAAVEAERDEARALAALYLHYAARAAPGSEAERREAETLRAEFAAYPWLAAAYAQLVMREDEAGLFRPAPAKDGG